MSFKISTCFLERRCFQVHLLRRHCALENRYLTQVIPGHHIYMYPSIISSVVMQRFLSVNNTISYPPDYCYFKLNDSNKNLYIISSTTTTAAYKCETRYPSILILTVLSLRSSTSITDELQLNPDFELCSLGVGWVSVPSSLFLIEY